MGRKMMKMRSICIDAGRCPTGGALEAITCMCGVRVGKESSRTIEMMRMGEIFTGSPRIHRLRGAVRLP